MLNALTPALVIAASLITPLFVAAPLREWTLNAGLLFAISAYAGLRLAVIGSDGRGRTMQFFFWVYAYFFLGLAPLAQITEGIWPWPSTVSTQTGEMASVIIVAALLAYETGRMYCERRPPTVGWAQTPRVLSPKRMLVVLPVAALVSIGQIIRIGPSTLLADRESFSNLLAAGAGADARATAGLTVAALISASFASAYLIVLAKRNKVIHGWALTSVFLVTLALFASNPNSSARYVTTSVWVGILMALLWPLTRKAFLCLALAVTGGLLVIFPLLNVFRREGGRATTSDSLNGTLIQGDYDSFQQIANTVDHVSEHGHTYGHQFLSALLFFVPRSLWPEKGLDTGALVGASRGYYFTNLSAPLPAEMYIDGGLFLVVLAFLVLGAFTVWAERQAQKPITERGFVGLMVPMVSVYQVIILRGSLLQSMGQIMSVMLIVWLCTAKPTVPDIRHPLRHNLAVA
ncbi:oligosaccharide repeat unit polymerase [Arthrobacter sp. AK04]|uniref:O-antigen polymerase n=1 Tax=Arthrobacter sp. AK04 TaxID=2900048 RepID=UPI001E57D998|nr:O-antigen polymerase [Arthrobacter sp. AK04]MCD5343522.1 oligosaccharide repeat unit polymerase [Arthrobacter sp. AK04]